MSGGINGRDGGSAHSWDEDPDATAGEYVLGTLEAAERAAFA